jgi:hypothetical protein
MKRTLVLIVAIAGFSAVCSAVYAVWDVSDRGAWPESWPKELEPLRVQSRTLVGGQVNLTRHEIPFAKREDFESAWPHILKLKSKGAPVILVRGPYKPMGKVIHAGVVIHCPPASADRRANPEKPLPGTWPNVRQRWLWTTFIELVVDGKIVDLNRIPLPADTPMIDERFDGGQRQSLRPNGG